MSYKTNRILAVILVMLFAINIAGCTGSKKLSEDPSDAVTRLEKAINSCDADKILGLTTLEKGSSVYKDYKDSIDVELYDDEIAACYKAVAESIKINVSDSDIETVDGIAKVKATFTIPEWRKVFADSKIDGYLAVTEAVRKADTEEMHLTIRFIDTKDGLKIKNVEDLMELFDFVGYDIVSSTSWGDPNGTKPSESETKETKPKETEPSETKPSETEPSETEPSTSNEPTKAPRKGSKEDLAKAYADYAKRIETNKDKIEWFEQHMNSNACGLVDITGDDIPELYVFSKGSETSKVINFTIYSYDPAKQKSSIILIEALTDPDSKITEYFIIRTKDNKIVSYKGYLDDSGTISEYCIYSSKGTGHFMEYTGNLFLTLGPEVKGKNGESMQIKVCTVKGIDKYKDSTTIEVDEFHRLEKALVSNPESVFSANYQKNFNSVPYQLIGNAKSTGISYSDLLKQLS